MTRTTNPASTQDNTQAEDHDTIQAAPQRRRRLPPEARRAQLLDVALSVFAEMGIERAGHADIAKRVGVSTATVFNYFPTRDALVDAVLEEAKVRIDRMFEDIGPLSDDPVKRILQGAAAYQRVVEDSPDLVKMFLKWGVSFDPDIRPRYLAYQKSVLQRLVKLLPESEDPMTEARLLYAAANSMAVMLFDGESLDVLTGYSRRIARALAKPDA